MSEESTGSRSERLDRALSALLTQTPEIEAAAVVSFDGLPMASALPAGMDEDRVAAMSAALLSLGERAAQGLGRGELSQVYIEGESGTVYLVSADDEAVLVAVAAKGAKVGMMLYEVRRAAGTVADVLRDDEPARPVEPPVAVPEPVLQAVRSVSSFPPAAVEPALAAVPSQPAVQQPAVQQPAVQQTAVQQPAAAPANISPLDADWSPSYAPLGSVAPPAPSSAPHWS